MGRISTARIWKESLPSPWQYVDGNLIGPGADLRGAVINAGWMTDVDMRNAVCGSTSFSGLDLSVVPEAVLTSLEHREPSYVDSHTLRRSQGRLPTQFLRGCGFTDWEIVATRLYDPSLREDERTNIVYEIVRLQQGQPIMFHSVFVSYSSSDEDFATKLHADLQNAGVRCWFAKHDMASGRKVHEQIDRAIQVQDRQDRLLLILSSASMSSNWVKTEIANARARECEQRRQVLFPIRLVPFEEIRGWKVFDADRGDDSAREIREYFIPDFSNWKDEKSYKSASAFEGLLKDLRA
jgi:hypothetical protein